MKRSISELSNIELVRLKSTLDESCLVCILNSEGVMTYVNQLLSDLSGFAPEELIGKSYHSLLEMADKPHLYQSIWQKINQGLTWEGELCYRSKSAQSIWVQSVMKPFFDSQAHLEQCVCVQHIVKESKPVADRFSTHSKKLEMSHQDHQDFASTAAHDLQEPLRKIRSFIERLKVKTQAILNEEALDYVQRIENAASRMQNLITDLLTYSRVTSETQPFSEVSLDGVMKDVVSDLESRIESSGGQVVWKNLPSIEADAAQIHRLLLNLISNALKFHRPQTPPQVIVESQLVRDFMDSSVMACELRIKDNGIGFEEQYLNRIFTMFQRLHGRSEYEGTGIGLAICHKIVARHKGHITAQSKVGEGSVFIVTLPVKQKMP